LNQALLKKSKCYELDLLESGIMINVDAIPSATSPTIETLPSVSKLVDKQMSEAFRDIIFSF
jgi:hypothetical protein